MTQEKKDIFFIDINGVNFDFTMEMNRRGTTAKELEDSPLYIGFKIDGKMKESTSLTVIDPERMRLFTDAVKRMANFRITISEICGD